MGLSGVPRFAPEVTTNFRSLPAFRPTADAAAADLFGDLSNVMDGVVNQVQRIQAQRVAVEAEEAGQAAGASSGFDPRALERDFSVAGQAFRKGALQSYAAQLELGRDEAFNRFMLEYEAIPEQDRDPALLQSRLTQWIEGTARTLPVNMQPAFRQLAMSKANPLVLQATRGFLATRQQRAKNDSEALLSLYEQDLLRHPLPQNDVEQQAYDTTLVQWRRTLDALNLTDNEKALKAQELQLKLREQAIMAGFEQSTDPLSYMESFMRGGYGVQLAKGNVNPADYETALAQGREQAFQTWLDEWHAKGAIKDNDYQFYQQNGFGFDYDFRAAFQAGATPSLNEKDGDWHWSDLGKKPNHPTFSGESKYSDVRPELAGRWEGENFIPPSGAGLDDGFTFEERKALVDKMEASIKDVDFIQRKRQVELSFGEQMQLELDKNDMEGLVADGATTENAIVEFAAQRKGHVPASWVADQITKLREKQQAFLDDEAEMAAIATGAVPIDPTDAKTQKRLNTMYGRMMGGGAPTVPIEGATVTSGFGPRSTAGLPVGASRNHPGVDFAAPAGTAIRPTVAGEVLFAGQKGGYGNMVEVLQDDGHVVRYAHNERNLVTKGDRVGIGQAVALVGQTGTASGPHAHIEVFDPDGKRIDPQAYFQKPGLQPVQTEEEKLKKTVQFAHKFQGFLPDTFRNETVGWLHGNDLQRQQDAVRRLSFMLDAGLELKGFSKQDRALAARVHEDMKRGIDPLRALEMARLATDPANANLVAGNQQRIKDMKLLDKPENQPERVFESAGFAGFFRSLPGIPITGGVLDGLHADWKKLFTDAYLETGGHEEAARKIAARQIQKLYGVTKVEGRERLMKYPPEQYYQIYGRPGLPDADVSWIHQQLVKDITGAVIPVPKPNDIFLVSDGQTAREASTGRPSYAVLLRGEDGMFRPFLKEGKQQRWFPDVDAELKKARKAHQKQQAAHLDAAKQRREASLNPPARPKPFNMVGK